MSERDDRRYVSFRQEGGVATITLERPEKLNAINHDVGTQLYDAFLRCERDRTIRAVVLAGSGRAFCAGDEIGGDHRGDSSSGPPLGEIRHYVSGAGRWTATVKLMQSLAAPVVARVHGYAYGAGMNLALAADFRVMASDASMAAPFIRRGMATGVNQLHRFVGIGKALELTLLGDPVDAAEALRLGLVTQVVPPEELDPAVAAFAERLAHGPTAAMGLTKHAVYASWSEDVDTAFWHQAASFVAGRTLEDRDEGRTAFREKRPPRFTGR